MDELLIITPCWCTVSICGKPLMMHWLFFLVDCYFFESFFLFLLFSGPFCLLDIFFLWVNNFDKSFKFHWCFHLLFAVLVLGNNAIKCRWASHLSFLFFWFSTQQESCPGSYCVIDRTDIWIPQIVGYCAPKRAPGIFIQSGSRKEPVYPLPSNFS